jgi:hypothetical protein
VEAVIVDAVRQVEGVLLDKSVDALYAVLSSFSLTSLMEITPSIAVRIAWNGTA